MLTQINNMFACCNLVGKNMNGWNVVRQLPKPDLNKGETGGNFSICYIVEKNGKEYFMKVLDLRKCFNNAKQFGFNMLDLIAEATQEFKYEMELSKHCSTNHVKNIINFLDGGEIIMNEFIFNIVDFIIYEKADGNIRHNLSFSNDIMLIEKLKALTYKLRSLHEITLGINQLHNLGISHQDLKPSNILTIGEQSKIGDLGRSLCLTQDVFCPFTFTHFNGDRNYAPPEALFNYMLPDEKERLYQMDNYMIGSLIVFYICGVSFNTIMDKFFEHGLRKFCQSGISFDSARVYLINAYHSALLEFENNISCNEIKDDLTKIVGYLCNPEPERRGHPKNIPLTNRTPNYDLSRTITELDVLQKKVEIFIHKK